MSSVNEEIILTKVQELLLFYNNMSDIQKARAMKVLSDKIESYTSNLLGGKGVILLYGLSGVGKTTLSHYLMGCPLVWKIKEGVVSIYDAQNTPCDQDSIGHSLISKTLFPYSNQINENINLYDTPGLRDVRGWLFDMIKGKLIINILKNTEKIKFFLLVDEASFQERGADRIIESISTFQSYVGNNFSKYKDSILLGISKGVVELGRNTNNESIEFIKKRIDKIIKEIDLPPFHKDFLSHVKDSNKIEYFLKRPKDLQLEDLPKDVSLVDKERIIQAINNLESVQSLPDIDVIFCENTALKVAEIIKFTQDFISKKIEELGNSMVNYYVGELSNGIDDVIKLKDIGGGIKSSKEFFKNLDGVDSGKSLINTMKSYTLLKKVAGNYVESIDSHGTTLDLLCDYYKQFEKNLNLKVGTCINSWRKVLSNITKNFEKVENYLNNKECQHFHFENGYIDVVCSGAFIKISEIPDISHKDSISITDIRSYVIHGFNTVYFDKNITNEKFFSGVNLVVMAPKWNANDFVKVVLDGKKGESHDPIILPANQEPGSKGEDGLTGKAGNNSGNFLGLIGKSSIALDKLSISAVGGKGGDGQDGTDGVNGKAGDRAPQIPDACKEQYLFTTTHNMMKGINAVFWEEELRPPECNHLTITDEREEAHALNPISFYVTTYKLFGKDGQRGGGAGAGGKGGIGGNSGKVEIINLGNDNLPSISSDDGLFGNCGKHGRTGEGGLHGNAQEREYQEVSTILCNKEHFVVNIILALSTGYVVPGACDIELFQKLIYGGMQWKQPVSKEVERDGRAANGIKAKDCNGEPLKNSIIQPGIDTLGSIKKYCKSLLLHKEHYAIFDKNQEKHLFSELDTKCKEYSVSLLTANDFVTTINKNSKEAEELLEDINELELSDIGNPSLCLLQESGDTDCGHP